MVELEVWDEQEALCKRNEIKGEGNLYKKEEIPLGYLFFQRTIS